MPRASRRRAPQPTPPSAMLEALEARCLLTGDPSQPLPVHAPQADFPTAVLNQSASAFAGMSGRADTRVNASVRNDGAISLLFDNRADRPTLFSSTDAGQSWAATDLLSRVGLSEAQTNAVTWTDPKDQQTYAAFVSDFSLYSVTQSANGAWSSQNLSAAAGLDAMDAPLYGLTTFTTRDNIVYLAGTTRTGDVVVVRQTIDPDYGDANGWTATNLTDELQSRGLIAPEFTGDLVPYVTTWNALTLAGLDANGDIQTIWTAPGLDGWRTSNLSTITGAPTFVGAVTPFLTSWGGINIAGMTDQGSLEAVWWVPSFGAQWRTVNLSQSFNGPGLKPATLSSFVTPWGGLNVVGLREGGAADDSDLVAYWWAPGRTEWAVSSLTSGFNFQNAFAGPIDSEVTPDGQFNLVGADRHGDIIRYSWRPGDTWREQSVSALATPAHAAEVVTLDTDIERVLVNAPTEVFLSAYVPFATAGQIVRLYNQPDAADAVLELRDDGNAATGDLIAGDGIYAACYIALEPAAGERTFAAALASAPDDRATASITAIDAPTEERLNQIQAQASDFQRKLSEATSGVLDLAAFVLDVSSAPGVDDGSVRVNEEGVTWQTDEGIIGVALVNAADYEGQRAGGPNAGAGGGSLPLPPNTTGNEALILGPYFYQFEPQGGDESDDITAILNSAGVGATAKWNTDPNTDTVTLDDFKAIGGYDIVSIVSHGAAFPEYGVIIDTGVDITPQAVQDNLADLISGRLAWAGSEANGTFAITPDFVRRYAGDMTGAVVYIGACKSAFDRSMADAFLAAGADAYIGYTDIVQSSFANERGIRTFQHLAQGGLAGDIPGVNIDTEAAPDPDPATFALFGQPDAPLPMPGADDPTDPQFDPNLGLFFTFAGTITAGDFDIPDLVGLNIGDGFAFAYQFNQNAIDQAPGAGVGRYESLGLGYLAIGDQELTAQALPSSFHEVYVPGSGGPNSEYIVRFDFQTEFENLGPVEILVDIDLSTSSPVFGTDALPSFIDINDFENGTRAFQVFVVPVGQTDAVAFAQGQINAFTSPNGSSFLDNTDLSSISYSAVTTTVSDSTGLFPGLEPGQASALTFVYEGAASDLDPSPAIGRYNLVAPAVTLGLGSFSLVSQFDDTVAFIDIELSPGAGQPAHYQLQMSFSGILQGYGEVYIDILLILESSDPDIFPGDELPITLDAGAFDVFNTLFIDVYDPSDTTNPIASVQAEILGLFSIV